MNRELNPVLRRFKNYLDPYAVLRDIISHGSYQLEYDSMPENIKLVFDNPDNFLIEYAYERRKRKSLRAKWDEKKNRFIKV